MEMISDNTRHLVRADLPDGRKLGLESIQEETLQIS